MAYLDDLTLARSVQALEQAFKIVEEEIGNLSLTINQTKSKLLTNPEHLQPGQEVPESLEGLRLTNEGLILLGAPVGDDPSINGIGDWGHDSDGESNILIFSQCVLVSWG